MTILLSVLIDIESDKTPLIACFAVGCCTPRRSVLRAPPRPSFSAGCSFSDWRTWSGWGKPRCRVRDADALARFFAWVNTWTPRNKTRREGRSGR